MRRELALGFVLLLPGCGGEVSSACSGASCPAPGGGTECVDLDVDVDHCGSCSNECAWDEVCVQGACFVPEEKSCEDEGFGCSFGEECVSGVCECAAPTLSCWDGCLDPSADPLNCGACGALCENSTSCEEGECQCPDGLVSCEGTCVDLERSLYHCGGCGGACEEGEICLGGQCAFVDVTSCESEALSINIDRAAIYQGVEIDLLEGDQLIPQEQRRAPVVQGRDALVRVFVEPLPGFVSQRLVARLTLENESNEVFSSAPLLVEAASSQEDLSSTLNIEVPGGSILESTSYFIEVRACEAQVSGTLGNVRVPDSGSGVLAARQTDSLSVHLVPIRHDGRMPDISEEILEAYEREVERQFPATRVEIEVGEPLESDQTGIIPELGFVLEQVTERRAEEAAPDDVYYYGLIDPAASLEEYCDGGCVTGIAWWLEDVGAWSRAHRVGVGIGFAFYGANTFAHELGHNLGRDHAPCNAEGDLDYPYRDAIIGVWGYDRLAGILKSPTEFNDVMSYCEPNWVSDYTYKGIAKRLENARRSSRERSLESQRGGEAGETREEWASFVVTPAGSRWTKGASHSGAPTSHPERAVVYDVSGEALLEVEAHRLQMADGGGYKLFVPKPEPGWFAIGLPGEVALPYDSRAP